MMGFTTFHILFCLLTVFTLTTQDLAKLHVSSKINAECGKQVILICNVSLSLEGLSIKHMGWSHNKSLCSVDSTGQMTTNHNNAISDFHCEYNNGQLSLIFQEVQPLETGHSTPYTCKLHSNKGVPHAVTKVELQECGIAEGVLTSDGPSCTFRHVYPDGDVHWFHSSLNLSNGSLMYKTFKRVEKGGFLTIHSHLESKGLDLPFTCSLKSTKSGRYIANTEVMVRAGAGSLGSLRTILCISILFAVSLTKWIF
ncbi:hypothetical protein PAMP_020882 [Pampus punctatissimus]